ncbi:MAG: thioredoxin [Fibrobacter sp.]|nr:thioredoxin [Fibrobacter sp.]
MASFELNQENLESSIKDNEILLIDFWAEWCGPCRMFGPIFEKAAEKHKDIAFAKCDTEAEREVAGSFGITSIPTIAAFRDGIMVYMQPGVLPEPALDELIQKIKDLDMDKVRAEVEEQQKKA